MVSEESPFFEGYYFVILIKDIQSFCDKINIRNTSQGNKIVNATILDWLGSPYLLNRVT